MMTLVQQLHASLSQRWTPEMVVKLIVDERLSLYATEEQRLLLRARPQHATSSMSTSFAKADDLRRQLSVAEALFGIAAPCSSDPVAVADYIESLCATLQVPSAESGGHLLDFKENRLCRRDRKKIETAPRGHRAYNKRFRLLQRMEKKLGAWLSVASLRELAQVARSRLAFRVKVGDLVDEETACLVAYVTARLNKRSMFTFGKQERAFDEIADMLLGKLGRSSGWLAVAYVHPAPEVLSRLTEEECGRLLGAWYEVMIRAAKILKAEAEKGGLDLENLIVRRGNDSSTWNEAAGAFTKARDGWIGTLYAMGAEGLLSDFAPGKALRLMAADVAYGHRAYGSGLEPDTAVWNALPKPWDVVLGQERCTRRMIEEACAQFKIAGKGWVQPRDKTVAKFRPTPELVHGVVCSCPQLAITLKGLGYFGGPSKSGERASGWVDIEKELDGLTVKVDYPDRPAPRARA